jgi:hypothetical protein
LKVLKPFKRLGAFKLSETHLKGFRANTAYDLVVPPPNVNIIPSGYAFRRKRNEDGKITCHKA